MHFDDRLGTVLRIRADGEGLRRIQYRQLLDLLGTSPAEARGDQLDAAFVRLGELAVEIPADQRADILAEPGLRLRSPRLVAALAAGEPVVARTALIRAQLAEEQWLDLLPALPPAARAHLRARDDLAPALADQLTRLGIHDRGLPPAQVQVQTEQAQVTAPAQAPAQAPEQPQTQSQAPAAAPPRMPTYAPPPAASRTPAIDLPATAQPAADLPDESSVLLDGIGALVRRIEAYRKAREETDQRPLGDSPRLPLGEDHLAPAPVLQSFDFATDAAGQIVWSDPAAAPMAIGLRLAGPDSSSGLAGTKALDEALRRRQPLRAQPATIAGAPAIAGQWQIDAAPWFDPLSGRHLGWRGRMRRPAAAAAAPPPAPAHEGEADRIRQLLHELRTPVNAIQGFAEVIQQQLFGPTPHEYRALASAIVGDAARMLSAFEELERLAKLETAAIELESGLTDAAEIVGATIGQLCAHAAERGNGFDLRHDDAALPVPLARVELERVTWRMLATLAGISAPGEVLKTRLRAKHGEVRLDVALPVVLAARSEEDLFRASAGAIPQVISAGVFGVGFSLRLARAEARAAGGNLVRKGDRLRLTLPLASTAQAAAQAATHIAANARAATPEKIVGPNPLA